MTLLADAAREPVTSITQRTPHASCHRQTCRCPFKSSQPPPSAPCSLPSPGSSPELSLAATISDPASRDGPGPPAVGPSLCWKESHEEQLSTPPPPTGSLLTTLSFWGVGEVTLLTSSLGPLLPGRGQRGQPSQRTTHSGAACCPGPQTIKLKPVGRADRPRRTRPPLQNPDLRPGDCAQQLEGGLQRGSAGAGRAPAPGSPARASSSCETGMLMPKLSSGGL